MLLAVIRKPGCCPWQEDTEQKKTVTSGATVGPEHDKLTHAVRWFSDHGPATAGLIDQTPLRFNLSPVDAEFLRTSFMPGPGLLSEELITRISE